MDNIISSDMSSSDPKTAILNQVRAEAAMTNARALITVSTIYYAHPAETPLICFSSAQFAAA